MPDDQEDGAPFQLPFSPPDCSYSLILQHEERSSSARTATARYFELRGMIVASVEFLEDSQLRASIESALANPKNNLNINIIRNYKAEIAAGTPYTVVFECEFSRLIPIMETLWTKTKRGLITQQFLVWTISDSEAQVEGQMLDGLQERMRDRATSDLRNITPRPEKLVESGGLMALQTRNVEMIAPKKTEEVSMAPLDPMPSPRAWRQSRENRRLRSHEELADHLPKDYQVPADVDEQIFRNVPDDEEFDADNYVATDEEIDEASKVWERAIRRKLAEKERAP
jgi:hypothetical protein